MATADLQQQGEWDWTGALRLILLSLLVGAIVGALILLFGTAAGRQYLDRDQLLRLGANFHNWVTGHRAGAVAAFVGLYIVLAVLALPLWWLQILGGRGFGLGWGIVLSQAAAVLAAALTTALSQQLAGPLFQAKVESRRQSVRNLSERMGHNGFLVVLCVRLVHIVPFGLSNYVFGLVHVRPRDVALATFLGNIPVVLFYTGVGAGEQPWGNWRFLSVLAGCNLIMLLPLAVRYFRPAWLRKIGLM